MTPHHLIRLAGIAAILGGALRMVSAFIPYVPDSAPLEVFYLVIDLALLFGLIGGSARVTGRLGWAAARTTPPCSVPQNRL